MISETQHTLEIFRDLIDVTSNHRPDTNWTFTDSHGHIHCWHYFSDGKVATSYKPDREYFIPSIEWVKTGVDFYEDGSQFFTGHYQCIKCHDVVIPKYTSDTVQRYVAGMTHYLCDGKRVSPEEFIALLEREKDENG